MTYRERREARAERLEGWADKRAEKADAGFARASDMASVIPFGQPILVGHHSERRDRNYRNRIDGVATRAIEDHRMAESMAGRAATIKSQLDEAIYDDDPDAIERLEERIAALEARRAQMTADNAAFRAEHRAELKAMTAYQRSQAVPHAAYELSNLSGNLKRNRDRLTVIRAQQARAAHAEEAGGVAIVPQGAGYISVTFAEKPEREVLDALKGAGFWWRKGSWWGKADSPPEGLKPAAPAADTAGVVVIGLPSEETR